MEKLIYNKDGISNHCAKINFLINQKDNRVAMKQTKKLILISHPIENKLQID